MPVDVAFHQRGVRDRQERGQRLTVVEATARASHVHVEVAQPERSGRVFAGKLKTDLGDVDDLDLPSP